jgi:hypothetical protein
MILGQSDKPSIDELIHYGTKGMKWGVRKQRSAEKRAARGDKLRRKKAPNTRAFVRNGSAWLAANAALMGVTVGAVALAVPSGGVSAGFVLPAWTAAVATGAQVGSVIATGAAGTQTIRDIRAIRASKKKG